MRPVKRPLDPNHALHLMALPLIAVLAAAFEPALAAPGQTRALATEERTALPRDEAEIEPLLLPSPNIARLREKGPGILPIMARIYGRSDIEARAVIANAFYQIGWKSPEAKHVLMEDAHTANEDLRLQVQWALGRVSNDPDVVDVLLANMQNDGNPLFRDKAACALANDQIHLTEEQKIHLYARLIQALRDPKPQVRDIAIKVLAIHTGQNKGFQPNAPLGQREERIRAWEEWLEEYRANQ